MITNNDLRLLTQAASLAGFNVEQNLLQLLQWDEGVQTHVPEALPANSAAIYLFKWQDRYLKVGKVNQNSNARYQFQHYNPDSSPSNLAQTLRDEPEFHALVGQFHDTDWGLWIRENTTRYNIIIPADLGVNFVHFAEAFFILKCRPVFENSRV